MKILVRVLAVIGGFCLVLFVIAAIAFWSWSVPVDRISAGPTPSPSSTVGAGPTPTGAGEFVAEGTSMLADRFETETGVVRDIHAVARGLRRTGTQLTATQVDIDATVPFASVEARLGPDVALSHDGNGRVRAKSPIVFLGRKLLVSAIGQVVPDGRNIVVHPVAIDIAGPDVLQGPLLALSERALTFREEVPGVPEGMTVTSLAVRDDGFRVHLKGTDVRLDR